MIECLLHRLTFQMSRVRFLSFGVVAPRQRVRQSIQRFPEPFEYRRWCHDSGASANGPRDLGERHITRIKCVRPLMMDSVSGKPKSAEDFAVDPWPAIPGVIHDRDGPVERFEQGDEPLLRVALFGRCREATECAPVPVNEPVEARRRHHSRCFDGSPVL